MGTNITDTPGDGTTITRLVEDHDRGSLEFNCAIGGEDDCGADWLGEDEEA